MIKLSFDSYLNSYVGFGLGQLNQFLLLGFVCFVNGFVILFMTILLQILQIEWNLSENQVIMLGTTYYLGMMIGQIFLAFYADSLGRKNMIMIGILVILAGVLQHAQSQTFIEVLLLRFALGWAIGISIHLSLILLSEQTPQKYRGRVVVTLQLVYLIGMYYMFFCCWILLESLEAGNWRAILLINGFPILLCLLLITVYLRESPRLTLIHSSYSETFKRLNEIGSANKRNYRDLSYAQKDNLIKWQHYIKRLQVSRNISDLFNRQNRKVTILLWGIMLLWNLQSTSIFIIAPFIMNASGKGLFSLFISQFWQLPATIFVLATIDSKRWGGRKRMVIYGLILYIVAEFMIYYYRSSLILFGMVIIKIADKLIWLSLNQLKIESYLTFYRTLGVGMAESMGKISATCSSFIVFNLFYIDPYLPFLVLGLLSIVTLVFVTLFPIDLTQQPLDDGIIQQVPQEFTIKSTIVNKY